MQRQFFDFDTGNLRERRLVFVDSGEKLKKNLKEMGAGTINIPIELLRKGFHIVFGEPEVREAKRKKKVASKVEKIENSQAKPDNGSLFTILSKKRRLNRTISKYERKKEIADLKESAKEAKREWKERKSEHPGATKRGVGRLGIREVFRNNVDAGKRIIMQDTRNAISKISWPIWKPVELGWQAASFIPKKVMADHRKYKEEAEKRKDIKKAAKAKMRENAKIIPLDAYKKRKETEIVEHSAKLQKKENRKNVPFFSLKHKPFSDKKWRRAA